MKNIHHIIALTLGLLCAAPSAPAQNAATASPEKARALYITNKQNAKVPYRIPAVAVARNGHIIAINDSRPCGNDIGYGEVDILSLIHI